MKKWLLWGLLLPVMALASVSDDFMVLGKDSDGSELFIIKSTIIYQKPIGLKVDVKPQLGYVVLENFANPKPINGEENKYLKSASYQFFADCPIDIHRPKPPFQGGIGRGFTEKNAKGSPTELLKSAKPYSIDDDMVIRSHMLVCAYVANHVIPTVELDFSAK